MIRCTAVALLCLGLACDRGDKAVPGEPAPPALPASPAPPTPNNQEDAPAVIAIPNAKVFDGTLVGGQPTREHLERAAADGYATIINLRSSQESGFEFEADATDELGLSYHHIPVTGAGGLTRDNVEALDRALAGSRGKVMVHCASGNRVGALFALRAAWVQGKSPEEAIAIGKAAGLTGLEEATKAALAE